MFTDQKNALCVLFDGMRPVPLASRDPYTFETAKPERVGDDAVIAVECGGKVYRRHVRLLLSSRSMAKRSTFLVDMGPA